jgi:hypothetical protein
MYAALRRDKRKEQDSSSIRNNMNAVEPPQLIPRNDSLGSNRIGITITITTGVG